MSRDKIVLKSFHPIGKDDMICKTSHVITTEYDIIAGDA